MNRIIFLVVFSMSMSINTFGQSKKIEKFWDELKSNESSISNLEPEIKIDEINSLIKEISSNLSCEISINNDSSNNHKENLIITANGNKDFFKLVDKIISLSYNSQYWNFIALRQKNPDYIGFELKDKQIFVDGMAFIPIETEQGLAIKFIVFDKVSNIDKNFIETYGPLVIDNLIGEKEFAQEIIAYDFYFKSEIKETKAIPLRKLDQYITKRKEFYNREQ